MAVKNRLKSYRHKLEKNQKEMADYLEVDKSQYNQWENNERQPSWENAFKMKKKLKLKYIDDLFYEAP